MSILRSRLTVAYALIIAVHLALVLNAFPPAVVFGGAPVGSPDYQTHFAQTRILSQASARFGRTWAYDPGLLAGQPEGLVFSLDNRGHAAFSRLLERAGVQPSTAFNLFPLLSCLLLPLMIWFAARLLAVGRAGEVVATTFAVLLWQFDWAPHFAWRGGMISFATVSYASVLALAAFHCVMSSRRMGLWLLLALVLPLLVLIHVLSVVILLVPMVALYLHRFRRIGRLDHALTWAVAGATLAVSMIWLHPVLARLDLVAPSTALGQSGPGSLLHDYIGIHPIDPTSIGAQTPFRFAAFTGAVMTLRIWRRDRDGRFFFAVVSFVWLLCLTYLSSLIPVLGQTEPYRFVFPAMMMAAVVSSPWLVDTLTPARMRELQPFAKGLVVVLLVLLLPRFIRPVMLAIPELEPSWRPAAGPGAPALQARTTRIQGVPPDDLLVARLLEERRFESGRVLVQSWPLAELLHWATVCPIVGGFPERRLIHQSVNPFRDPADPRLVGDALSEYLERYNVHYLIVTDPNPALERRGDLLEPVQVILRHRIYRVRKPSTYFATGEGQVHAELNRLMVNGSRPAAGTQSLVLKFHWLDELRCRPGCRLERETIPADPAGFIRVVGAPTLPPDFTIENSYAR